MAYKVDGLWGKDEHAAMVGEGHSASIWRRLHSMPVAFHILAKWRHERPAKVKRNARRTKPLGLFANFIVGVKLPSDKTGGFRIRRRTVLAHHLFVK